MKKINQKQNVDGISGKLGRLAQFSADLPKFEPNPSQKASSLLFYKGKKADCFFTEDSRLYISPQESLLMKKGIVLDKLAKRCDSVGSRILKDYRHFRPENNDFMYQQFILVYNRVKEDWLNKSQGFFGQFSVVRLWNFSIIGAILIGMISTTLIYRYLGRGALADVSAPSAVNKEVAYPEGKEFEKIPRVLSMEKIESDYFEIEEILNKVEKDKKDEFEQKVREMVAGHPIEKMLPEIMEKDRTTIAFLIGIAKKESNWGKRVPTLNGQDCYNYWGYRAQRKLMGTGGHTCFNSRKDAVDTVAKRIDFLVGNKKLNTPDKMVIWKCGSACNQDDQAAVRKWISDVNLYFKKLNG